MSFLFARSVDDRYSHSFPTRRSSDLELEAACVSARGDDEAVRAQAAAVAQLDGVRIHERGPAAVLDHLHAHLDRKSTRLNSSHVRISYAVFCLKKKTSYNTLLLLLNI